MTDAKIGFCRRGDRIVVLFRGGLLLDESVKHGLYAVNFGGGQVDITSGKFVFSAAEAEACMIENGKVT